MSWLTQIRDWRLRRSFAKAHRRARHVHNQRCMRCATAIEEWCGRCPTHGYVCFRCFRRGSFSATVWCPTCNALLQPP